MSIVTYTIELLEPLLATGMEGDPNTKRSLDFMPGTMVRGAAIGLHLQQKEYPSEQTLVGLDNDDADERRWFLSDQTRFLNAYPLVDTTGYGSLQRSLPTPRSWLADKKALWSAARKGQTAVEIDDFAVAQRQVDGVQRSTVKDAFFVLADGRLHFHNPARRVSLHTARERTMGRATAGEGAVFHYDALAPGQHFSGFIVTASNDDAAYLANLLNEQEWSLGGSRSAGYGKILITAETLPDEEWHSEFSQASLDDETSWPNEDGTNAAEPSLLQPDTVLRILCLSHCIVRTAEGHFTTDLDDALGKKLQLPANALQRLPAHTHRAVLKVGGFNRTWGLPTIQSQAIAAGSVFVYQLKQPLSVTLLADLERNGIGEQRLDGYGCVVVNVLKEPKYKYSDTREIDLPDHDNAPPVDEYDLPLLRRIGQRMLRIELERELMQKIQRTEFTQESINRQSISKSQLSRLRLAVRTALEQLYAQQQLLLAEQSVQDTQAETKEQAERRLAAYRPVQQFLHTLRPTAREQLRRTRLINEKGPRLEAWLQEQLNPEEQNDNAFLHTTKVQPIKFGAATIKIPPAWEAEYTLRLIDGVLAQAAKMMATAEERSEQNGEEV